MCNVKEIRITLAITDPETVEEYADVHDELLYADLVDGTLMQETELVERVNVEIQD